MKSRIFLMFWQIITAVWQISVDLRVSGLICRRWDASLKIFGRMEKSPIPLVRKVIRAWEKMRKTMRKEKLNEVEAIWIIFESFERCQQVGLKVGFHLWSGWDLWTCFFLSRSSIYDISITDIRFKLWECRGWSNFLSKFLQMVQQSSTDQHGKKNQQPFPKTRHEYRGGFGAGRGRSGRGPRGLGPISGHPSVA